MQSKIHVQVYFLSIEVWLSRSLKQSSLCLTMHELILAVFEFQSTVVHTVAIFNSTDSRGLAARISGKDLAG